MPPSTPRHRVYLGESDRAGQSASAREREEPLLLSASQGECHVQFTTPRCGCVPCVCIAEPSKAVTFFDALPHEDTQYSVAYLDGHVKREAKAPNLAIKFVAKKAHAGSKKPRSRR